MVARFARIDEEIVGSPRRELFARLGVRAGTRFLVRSDTTPAARDVQSAEAVAMLRAGRVAEQIGPLYARNDSDAIDLLTAADAETEGDTFIDVPVGNQHRFADVLESLGYSGRRTFTRMVKSSPRDHESTGKAEEPARIYAIAGPEYG